MAKSLPSLPNSIFYLVQGQETDRQADRKGPSSLSQVAKLQGKFCPSCVPRECLQVLADSSPPPTPRPLGALQPSAAWEDSTFWSRWPWELTLDSLWGHPRTSVVIILPLNIFYHLLETKCFHALSHLLFPATPGWLLSSLLFSVKAGLRSAVTSCSGQNTKPVLQILQLVHLAVRQPYHLPS